MKEQQKSTQNINYTISLFSKTNKLRQKEALVKLKTMYPYRLENKNIRIKETDNKNEFVVFINREGFSKEHSNYYWIAWVGAALIIVIILFASIKTKIKNNQLLLQEQKQTEQQNNQKKQEEKELNERLFLLKNKVANLELQEYGKIYEKIEILYSLLKNHGIIENLFIENNNFSLDVTTNESMNLLERFEKSNRISEIKMTRTTVIQKKDFISLSGIFLRKNNEISEKLNPKSQLSCYEMILSSFEDRKQKQNNQNISDYIKKIRECINKTQCNEQYIQIKGDKNNLEIELFIHSSSKGIFSFLQQIQEGEDNLFDIKNLKIRNPEDSDNIQTLIVFKSGIPVKGNENYFLGNNDDYNFSPEEISLSLYKPRTKSENHILQNKKIERREKLPSVPAKKLLYIGQSKIGEDSYLIAKDEQLNAIYKFILTDSESSGNICYVNETGKIIARYKNELYEVKK